MSTDVQPFAGSAQWFAGEFFVACGINCWQALKQGVVPFPGVICRTAAAFGILSLAAYVDEDLAGLLGAGFLIALIVAKAQTNWQQFAALDPAAGNFYYLTFNGKGTTTPNGSSNG